MRMLQQPVKIIVCSALMAAPFLLAACGGDTANDQAIAELDEKLTGKGSDPAINAALDDRILVDPQLTDSANVAAVSEAAQPLNGARPADTGYEGSAASAKDLADTKIIHAPAPTVVAAEDCESCAENRAVTLGGLAKDEAIGRGRGGGKGTCDAKLQYGAAWATRMPAAFPVYPKGRVKEAGGVDGGICDIRVVSFVTSSPMKDIVDYYYTRARRSGYSAEYQIRAGEHTLGGVRSNDGGAYVVTFNQTAAGTTVDIVANNGR